MKSYNCFYSALFEVLEPQYRDRTNLLINNRWQFFYKQSDDYTDDKRMIGELPMLYDEQHLVVLREKMGLEVSFEKNRNSSIETFVKMSNTKYTMLFINQTVFMTNPSTPNRNCVSTIIAEKLTGNVFRCHTFDKDLNPVQQLDAETLYRSWMYASDYDQLNQCVISVDIPTRHTEKNLKDISKECMKISLANYLSPKNDGYVLYGKDGMKKFSNDILNWDNNDFKKIVDCAIYLDILVKQRTFFISTLKELSIRNKDTILEELENLMENWNKLKMLLFIVGTRRQNGARQQLSKFISELGDLEFNAVSNIMEALR